MNYWRLIQFWSDKIWPSSWINLLAWLVMRYACCILAVEGSSQSLGCRCSQAAPHKFLLDTPQDIQGELFQQRLLSSLLNVPLTPGRLDPSCINTYTFYGICTNTHLSRNSDRCCSFSHLIPRVYTRAASWRMDKHGFQLRETHLGRLSWKFECGNEVRGFRR